MKINKVKLYNFSSYEGNNEFDFEITDAEKNIVLIGGKNGAGKTSLFTAIKVALYGPLAYGYVGVNSHYISKIKDLINSKAFQQEIVESEVQITLQLKIERDIRNYVITRKWDYTNQRLTEEYTVERDGKQLNDQELSYFENYLRSIIPPDLFEFFLFDGEEVGNIFSTSAYNTYVRNAVFTMCGMDVFEIIRKFTRGYVTRNNSIDDDEAYDTYESAKQQMELLETEKENLESEVSNLTKELEDIEVQLTELTTAFKNAGGISRKEKKQLEDEFNQAEKVKTETLTNIKLFVEGLMPFYILRDFANPIMSQLDFEEKGEIFYYVQSKLNRDAISELLKGDVSDSKVDQLMDHLLDTFRPKAFIASVKEIFLNTISNPIWKNEKTLKIPLYQREYEWSTSNVTSLVREVLNRDKFLGMIILDEKEECYEIADGQQRLTTMLLNWFIYSVKDKSNNMNILMKDFMTITANLYIYSFLFTLSPSKKSKKNIDHSLYNVLNEDVDIKQIINIVKELRKKQVENVQIPENCRSFDVLSNLYTIMDCFKVKENRFDVTYHNHGGQLYTLEHFIVPDNRNAKIKWLTKDEESIEISFTGQSERKKKLINYLIVEQKLNNDILLDFDVIKKIELISDYYGNATPKHVGIITAHIENMESYKELKKLKNEEDEKEVENIRNCYNSFLDEYFSDNNQRTILNKLLEGLKLTFINS